MKRKIGILFLILICYLLQASLGRTISVGGIKPNFLIILPVIFGFLNGKNEGMFTGFFAGIMYDLFFAGLFGFSPLVFIYIGYFSGIFSHKYEEKEILIPLAILLVSDFVYEIMSYVGYFLLHNRLNVMFFISRIILPEIVYTLLIFIVFYKPMVFLNTKLEHTEKRRLSKFD